MYEYGSRIKGKFPKRIRLNSGKSAWYEEIWVLGFPDLQAFSN